MLRAFPSRRKPILRRASLLRLGFATAVLAFGAAEAGPTTPPPAASFDGLWTIEADVASVLCPVKKKKLTAFIVGGKVLAVWGITSDTATNGAVAPDGGVSIDVKAYGVNAHIEGKMDGKAGEGAWSSDSRLCTRGHWRAAATEAH